MDKKLFKINLQTFRREVLMSEVTGFSKPKNINRMIRIDSSGIVMFKKSPYGLVIFHKSKPESRANLNINYRNDPIFDFYPMSGNQILILTQNSRVYIFNYDQNLNIGEEHARKEPLCFDLELTGCTYFEKEQMLALSFFDQSCGLIPQNMIDVYRVTPDKWTWMEKLGSKTIRVGQASNTSLRGEIEYDKAYIGQMVILMTSRNEIFLAAATYGGAHELYSYTLRNESDGKITFEIYDQPFSCHESKILYIYYF